MPSEVFASAKDVSRKGKMFSKSNSSRKDQMGKKQEQPGSKGGKEASPGERYVVVISNVENDFSKIHQACLPSYLGLSAPSPLPSGKAQHSASGERSTLPSPCTWDLKCRSETRSAQLIITGPAEADVRSIFSYYQRSEKKEEDGSHFSASGSDPADRIEVAPRKRRRDNSYKESNKEEERKKTRVESVLGTPHHVDQGDKDEETEVLPQEESLHGSNTEESLKKRVAFLQRKPYFGYYLRFDLNIPGKENGEVLIRTGKKTCEKEEEKESREEQKKDDDSWMKKDGSGSTVRQSCCSQNELVTAVAAVSASLPSKELQRHLKDLPGFLSCWYLYSRHFRVVFMNAEALFKAKKLLDEFELEGNVRVHLHFSDFLTRKYEETLLLENNLGAPLDV